MSIIITGGTILYDDENLRVKNTLGLENEIKLMNELSENFNQKTWSKIARKVYIELKKRGAIFSREMSSEVAYVKLSWLIGNFGTESVDKNFFKPYAYEI